MTENEFCPLNVWASIFSATFCVSSASPTPGYHFTAEICGCHGTIGSQRSSSTFHIAVLKLSDRTPSNFGFVLEVFESGDDRGFDGYFCFPRGDGDHNGGCPTHPKKWRYCTPSYPSSYRQIHPSRGSGISPRPSSMARICHPTLYCNPCLPWLRRSGVDHFWFSQERTFQLFF